MLAPRRVMKALDIENDITHTATMSDDPTADFLAREKAILGDDADLFASGDVPGASSGTGAQSSGMDAFPDLDDGKC